LNDQVVATRDRFPSAVCRNQPRSGRALRSASRFFLPSQLSKFLRHSLLPSSCSLAFDSIASPRSVMSMRTTLLRHSRHQCYPEDLPQQSYYCTLGASVSLRARCGHVGHSKPAPWSISVGESSTVGAVCQVACCDVRWQAAAITSHTSRALVQSCCESLHLLAQPTDRFLLGRSMLDIGLRGFFGSRFVHVHRGRPPIDDPSTATRRHASVASYCENRFPRRTPRAQNISGIGDRHHDYHCVCVRKVVHQTVVQFSGGASPCRNRRRSWRVPRLGRVPAQESPSVCVEVLWLRCNRAGRLSCAKYVALCGGGVQSLCSRSQGIFPIQMRCSHGDP